MGLFSKFFGKREATKEDDRMSPKKAIEIIRDYGYVMEHKSPAPGCVADTKELPHTKARIKEALLIGLSGTTDTNMRNVLQIGYIQLADWQHGVGDTHAGLDLTNIDVNENIEDMAAKIVSQGEKFDKWQPIVAAEQDSLKRELIELGLWSSDKP